VFKHGLKPTWTRFYWTGEIKWGTPVGEDKFGNKYYEDKEESIIRDRWVEYGNWHNIDASQIPPEWHAWLHHMTDVPGQSPEIIALTPKYKLNHIPNRTGTTNPYSPNNFLFNPKNPAFRDPTIEPYLAPRYKSTSVIIKPQETATTTTTTTQTPAQK